MKRCGGVNSFFGGNPLRLVIVDQQMHWIFRVVDFDTSLRSGE